MGMYGEGIQTYSAMFEGFTGAARRFLDADDPTAAYISVFEALNWAVALDTRTAEIWAPRGVKDMPGWNWRNEIAGAVVLRGIRFARNAMHHDWAEVLEFAESSWSDGRVMPARWVWRPLKRLPPRGRDDPQGRTVYIDELEGRPVRSTLVGLHSGFGRLRSLLEPRVST
jgi:hypothetical protein